jgi:hypothetical protein
MLYVNSYEALFVQAYLTAGLKPHNQQLVPLLGLEGFVINVEGRT